MKGHIRPRGEGKFQIAIPIGKDANGKYKYSWETVHGSRKDAEARRAELLVKANAGKLIIGSKTTLGDFLDLWLEQYEGSWRPGTRDWYETVARVHIKPAIGHLPLKKLSPLQIQRWLNTELKEGIIPSTVHGHWRVLKAALNRAAMLKLIPEAPISGVEPPKRRRFGGMSMTTAQVIAFLRAAQKTDRYALYLAAVTIGMRRGELLGLRWQDVYLKERVIHVRQQLLKGGFNPEFGPLKTENGERVIPLPEILAGELEKLRKEQEKERKAYGKSYRDYGLVFTTLGGGPISPRNLHRQFKSLLAKAGLPMNIRLHDLRHTCATLLKANKVASKAISKQLGHYDEKFTEEEYTHVLEEMARESARVMDKLLGPLAGD